MVWRWLGVLLALLSVAAIGIPRLTEDEPFSVAGTFILWDDFVADTGESCAVKRSFYYDINSRTPVTLSTGDDRRLGETSLGDGRIAGVGEMRDILRAGGAELTDGEVAAALDQIALEPCVFRFDFTVRPGSDDGSGYVVGLGRRGTWNLTEEQIRQPGRLQLSMGLRSSG